MKYTYLCLSLLFVGMLLIPGGYAISSETSSTGTITSDSFTAVLYSDTSILNGSISYKVEDGKNVIAPDIYTLISGAHFVIGGNGTYRASFEVHFYDDNGELDADAYLFLNDEPIEDVTLSPDDVYTLQMNVMFSATEFTGTIRCEITIYIYTANNDCTYVDMDNCAVIEIHDDPAADLIEVTEGGDVEGAYIKTTTTVGGVPQVIISNSTNTTGQGVADADGNIDIVLNIPANTPFCIKIWNRESYDVRANITINNIVVNGSSTNHQYNNQKLGSGFARYFCYYTNHGSTYWSTTNLNNVTTNNGWLYSSNGTVTISIDGHYDDGHGNKAQDVRLAVIFKDMQ